MKKNIFIKNKIPKNFINRKIFTKFLKNYNKTLLKITKSIEEPDKTLNVLSQSFQINFKKKDLLQFKRFNTIVLIGMGGSILGSKAIYEFLKHKIKKKVIFFDNLSIEKISSLKKKINIKKTVFIIISKSGETVETLSNMFSMNFIKRSSNNIIVISEKNNFLYSLSKKFDLLHFEHKNHIGGRYSVLSEVGLIPAYLMGIDIKKFRKNLLKHIRTSQKFILRESTIKIASIIQTKNLSNLVFLNYSSKLDKLLYWCQQLIAESLGKKNKGLFPIISSVPKDHHSLLQLYLDGPKNSLFCFFSNDQKSNIKVNLKLNHNKFKFLQNKKISSIKSAQKEALKKIFSFKKIPFREFKVNNMNEETLGEIFSYFILETVLIGELVKINPFNQPAVEKVKLLTKNILS